MRKLRVAVTQHFVSHYRASIYNLLSRQQCPSPEYVIVSDSKGYGNIKTLDPGKAAELPQNGGLNWRFVKNRLLGKHFLWQSGLVSLSLKHEFDVIIYLGNMYHLSTWVSIILAKIYGKKTLMWTHGYLKEEKNLKGWIREKFYKLPDALLLYGHRSKDLLLKRGFNNKSLYVVYNSLDYVSQCQVRNNLAGFNFKELKEKIFQQPEIPVVIFIGRLTQQKKLEILIEAIRVLKEKGIALNLLFVGDGPEKKNLYEQVRHARLLDQVCFYGPSYGEKELGPLISMADICISPGEVGLTCMHAMVYGTPVITHGDADFQMPEFEAIQPGITGCFFSRDNSNSLAETIHSWMNEKQDRDKVRADCMKIIDEFYNPFYQVQIINEAILTVCGNSG